MKNHNKIKLTSFSPGAGWACKLSASDLTQVLSKLKIFKNHSGSSGYDSFDDCSIYQINENQSIIQSVDFFTPIVDDPYTFGQIAAANSLSDIYAMGGMPLFALNIVAFPSDKINLDVLSSILQGGIDKCNEAKINILGGHSIKDDVPKYGLAVTAIIDNNKIIKNNTARVNDKIILTKPIGTGIITTAIKKKLANKSTEALAVDVMNTLNEHASQIMIRHSISSCTDVTGFGLLGHLNEMCKGSSISAKIYFDKIPKIDGTIELAKKDIVPGGTKSNLDYLQNNIDFNLSLELYEKYILADAQTSGGLLIACEGKYTKNLIADLNSTGKFSSQIIGEFIDKKSKNIYCER